MLFQGKCPHYRTVSPPFMAPASAIELERGVPPTGRTAVVVGRRPVVAHPALARTGPPADPVRFWNGPAGLNYTRRRRWSSPPDDLNEAGDIRFKEGTGVSFATLRPLGHFQSIPNVSPGSLAKMGSGLVRRLGKRSSSAADAPSVSSGCRSRR
jgi:hypothetical protein